MAEYVSDTTTFIRDLLAKQPELVAEQQRNRATWWDKQLDLEALENYEASNVPVKGYAYFSVPGK